MKKSARGLALSERSESKGFTLVELLVVVSIIAILAVIGLVIFNGLQARARDATRKSDLEAISKAMEANYIETTGQYAALADSMFASGVIPKDPLTGSNCQTNVCKYCVKTSNGICTTTEETVGTGQPPVGLTYRVCANLEQGSPAYFCIGNQR